MPADGGGGCFSGTNNTHFSNMPGGARTFHFTNADDIFKNVFGTNSPFDMMDEDDGGMGGGGGRSGFSGFPGIGGMHMHMGGMPQQQQMRALKKADPINHTLYVTLEDLYTGTTKKMRITKKVVDGSGRAMQLSRDKEIVVKPGWKDGTKLTFEKEGDEIPGTIPADIIFTIQTRSHDRFSRDGDDLIYTMKVQLADALIGIKSSVVSLDNRTIPIECKNITPQTIKTITGEGMMNSKKKTKGDLKVKFDIIFPELSDQLRQQIVGIIKGSRR